MTVGNLPHFTALSTEKHISQGQCPLLKSTPTQQPEFYISADSGVRVMSWVLPPIHPTVRSEELGVPHHPLNSALRRARCSPIHLTVRSDRVRSCWDARKTQEQEWVRLEREEARAPCPQTSS